MAEGSGRRDRDESGRARNARPRDGLGRPLPYGDPGVTAIPDELDVTPAEALAWARELLDAGRPFQAHEVLEAVWKAAPPTERGLWRGLAQLAVGVTHRARGNNPGAVALLRRGAANLAPYADAAPHGVDAGGLSRWATALADQVADGPEPGGGVTPLIPPLVVEESAVEEPATHRPAPDRPAPDRPAPDRPSVD